MKNIRILALSGSLRKDSYNTILLKAVAQLAPNGVEVIIFNEMDLIPLFNPDRENDDIQVITKLRKELKKSDGLFISSPEYAHGISGVLKNTLDWFVSGEEFPYKPVALFNTSPRASHAQLALREVISTMSGTIIESASISIRLLGTRIDVDDIVNDSNMSADIIHKIKLFRDSITGTAE